MQFKELEPLIEQAADNNILVYGKSIDGLLEVINNFCTENYSSEMKDLIKIDKEIEQLVLNKYKELGCLFATYYNGIYRSIDRPEEFFIFSCDNRYFFGAIVNE